MDQQGKGSVSYWAYEGSMDRMDRANRRWWVLCIILVVLLVATNVSWVLYERQFEVTETTTIEAEQEADGNGRNYIIGGSYGQTEGESD